MRVIGLALRSKSSAPIFVSMRLTNWLREGCAIYSFCAAEEKLPVELAGKAIFHAGPIMREIEGQPGKYEVISVGPTTSMRMEKYEREFIAATGLKVIVGKGGMGPNTVEGCVKNKAIHTVFPGGCAVLAAQCVEEVERVEWLDLGMPEAMWVMRVKEFGPLIVSIDTHGGNLFEKNKAEFNRKKAPIVDEICTHLDFLD